MTTFYYYWYNQNDYFYGATYDTDSSQGLFSGYSFNSTDETGTSGFYYVYASTAGNAYSLGEDQAYTRYYYDGDTGEIDYEPYYSATYGYMAGSGMLTSYDYADFGTGDYSNALYGYNGYYEASSPAATQVTYNYYWTNGSDYYYGSTYDADGSQGLYDGYTYYATDETGASGFYYVYSSSAGNAYGLSDDQAYHTFYYDSESGQTDYSTYYTSLYGYALGSGMTGSYDYADFDDGDVSGGLYGYYGYYEATDEGTSASYWYYWTNGSDSYYGVTYDADGSQGLYDGYTYATTDENGLAGEYVVYSVTSGNAYGLSDDQAYHTYYYDGETGQGDTTLYYTTAYGYTFGTGMLGSYDYADFDDGDITDGFYGYYGYYEADDEAPDVTFYYYWSNGTDFYYGSTYDSDGSQGLYNGYTYSTTDENGNSSFYYVYSGTSSNGYGLGEDQARHSYYYDGETGQYDYTPEYTETYGYALGSGMLGSYDYVDFDDGFFDSNALYGSYGYYEADDESEQSTYYFYWYNGSDLYYGVTQDADGSQALDEGYVYYTTDDTGATGYYYVYASTASNVFSLGEDRVLFTSYYDGDTGQTDYDPYYSTLYGYALGDGMLTAYDYVDFDDGYFDGEGLFGNYGYYTATDEAPDNTFYYFWTNGSDHYYGVTYDGDGSQGLYDGYNYTTTDENGNTSTYYVYNATADNFYGMGEDQAFHDYYYDGETGQYDYDPYATSVFGYAYGSGMLGSYDEVDFDDGNYTDGLYGDYGYYEADDEAADATYYYYWYSASDFYYGVAYDVDGSQGLYLGYSYTTTDENGNTSVYYVYSTTDANAYNLSDDQTYHRYYYDGETGQYDYDPYYTTTYGYALGTGMLDAHDTVDFDDGDYTEGNYGSYGFYEADDTNPAGTTYSYVWDNGTDYYYGFTFDSDNSQGLSVGYTYNSTDETGASGYYYVYATTSGNTYSLGEDQAYHSYYYDGNTGQTDTSTYYTSYYGYAAGSGMIASYDFVDFGDGTYTDGYYGNYGLYEATDEADATYYYLWTSVDDYYYGYTYDADASQGLYVGYSYTTTDENGNTSTYYVYSSTIANTTGLSDDQAYHTNYYDGESGQIDYNPYYTTAYGYAQGSGMLGSHDFVDFDDGDYTDGNYGSNGYYEADDYVPAEAATYTFFWYNGTDVYYGYTYDEDGSQGLSLGDAIEVTDETGVIAYYYVYGETSENTQSLGDDEVFFFYYYDGETGQEDFDPYYSTLNGHAEGSGMLLAYDEVDFGDGDYTDGLFGNNGFYEADDTVDIT